MINSRKISDLHPTVAILADKHLAACKDAGIDIIITSTYRDFASQEALFAQGRTAPGKVVTNARPGSSFHNWRVAYDVVPLVAGKAIWNDKALWLKIGEIGESLGLEWAGRWKHFQESPHFQYTMGLTIADFKEGKSLNSAEA